MKKLLLTGLSLLALNFGASAQKDNILYDGDSPDQLLNGATWFVFDGITATETNAGTGSAAGNTGDYMNLAGASAGPGAYYVGGAGNAHYSSVTPFPQSPIGIRGTVAQNTLKFRVTTNNTSTKIKIEFETAAAEKFGYEFATMDADAAVKAGWTTITLPFSSLAEIVANNPTGPAPTDAQMQAFEKLTFVLVCTNNTGDCSAEANIDDVIVTGPGILSVNSSNSNISSSVIYPNPATENVTVKLDMKSAADVKVTLSDMMGREVAVIADEKTTSLVAPVNVSSLTKGLYTVNYFINGAPAKAELLMVK